MVNGRSIQVNFNDNVSFKGRNRSALGLGIYVWTLKGDDIKFAVIGHMTKRMH